jgi:peptidoglycan/LPS O-acetylase OafA/YrhL
MKGHYLSDVAVGRENNITFLRLIAALMVIWGHSNAVVQQGGQDIVTRITGYAHAGGVAVDLFFLMSGYLVTASIVNGGFKRYLVSRGLRIYPGLWVHLLLITLVMGPLLTVLSLGDYLADGQTWRYLRSLATGLKTEWFLPGVFESNRDKAVNGSIWSIVVEIRMYLVLALVYLLRVYRYPAIFNTLCVATMILSYSGLIAIPYLPPGSTDLQVASYFLLGSFLYVNRERIPVGPMYFLFALVLAGITVGTPKFPLAYALVLVTAFTWLAFGRQFHWLDRYDYSYGIYLYGWPVQQLVAQAFPAQGPHFNAVVSMIGATALGALSWHLVESPALRLKDFFRSRKVQPTKISGSTSQPEGAI